MAIYPRFLELHPEITAWRQDFHEHPELMFDTHRTSKIVANLLREFGCDEVVEGVGLTGVVGVIEGKKKGAGKVIGLRADMDALPIDEETNLPYASKNSGKMHACGHDGHSAMLLGAAKYLCETRQFDGRCVVIFQPAEEGGGGAKVMCDEGLMARFEIDEVYGMHNWPGLEAGAFAIRSGPFFAATDFLDVEFIGRGGHAAKPNDTIDPIIMASQAVVALQTIVSRNLDPTHEMVVSVTSIESSSKAFNVIAQSVRLKGTVRTLTPACRDMVEERIVSICNGIAQAFGGEVQVEYGRNYPVMVNHELQTEFAGQSAQNISGRCDHADLVMGGEDFAFMLEERPGAYILIGNGDTAAVHHPGYDFNDAIIPQGCSWWVNIVERAMPLT